MDIARNNVRTNVRGNSGNNVRNTSHREGVYRRPKRQMYVDHTLLFIVIFLLGFGLVMLYSTSSYEAGLDLGDSMYYLKRQFIFIVLGFVAMLFVSRIPYGIYRKLSFVIYAASVLLVLAVIPFGKKVNGAKRWIEIASGVNIQPAEVAKVAVIIFLASLICQMGKNVASLKGSAVILGVAVVPALLVHEITSNMSSAVIILGIAVIMLFVSTPGYKRYIFLGLLGAAIIALFIVYVSGLEYSASNNYRFNRILAWLDPEAYSSGIGFQTLQALYAIGSGGLIGKGLGESMQKMGFIPEAQNDMIFSIICEELGLFGAISIMAMFILLIWRLVGIAGKAKDLFGSLIVVGVIAHISIQVILNICVVTNTIPNTGITLPFISYGGSAVVFQLLELGLVLAVARESEG